MYESHRKKIESIMTRSTHSLSFRKKDVMSNYYNSHDRAQRFSQKCTILSIQGKQQAVEKQNDLILKKIIDVNRRTGASYHSSNNRDISHNNLSTLRKKLIKTNE
jgi:hypothetical protein